MTNLAAGDQYNQSAALPNANARLGADAALAINIAVYLSLLQVTYFTLRFNGRWLYFASYLEFSPESAWIALCASLAVGPMLFLILKRSASDPFAFLLAPLALIGGASGVVALAYADPLMAAMFCAFYLLVPFLLLFLAPPAIGIPRMRFGPKGHGLLLGFGLLGVAISAYLAVKYRSLLGLPGLADVYEFRNAFAAVVAGWERYAVTFAKFVGAFSLAAYAISERRSIFLAGPIFIFASDFMLAGHKASLAFILIILGAYWWFATRGARYRPYYLVVPLIGFLALVNLAFFLDIPGLPQVLGIYDRVFNVTSGLFVRYYDFANTEYFFWGGEGILGAVFGGVRESYHAVIGEHYFSKGVSANADLVSDAYINFGIAGVLTVLTILRLFFSHRDIKFFRSHPEPLAVIMLPFAVAIFSMGLQTALMTGGLIFGLALIKLATFSAVPDKPH